MLFFCLFYVPKTFHFSKSFSLCRHLSISLDILLKLVRVFGSMVYSAVLASTPVGVDIEAEQRCVQYHLVQFLDVLGLNFDPKTNLTAILVDWHRLERYNLCYIELERVKRCLPALTRFILICLF